MTSWEEMKTVHFPWLSFPCAEREKKEGIRDMPTLGPRHKQRWWVAVQKCCALTASLGWKWFKTRVTAGTRFLRNSAPPKIADKVYTNRRKAEDIPANQVRTHSSSLESNGRSLLMLLSDWSKTHRALPGLATRLSRRFVSRAAWSVLTRPSVCTPDMGLLELHFYLCKRFLCLTEKHNWYIQNVYISRF